MIKETSANYRLRKECQAIKNRYADGVPLNKTDKTLVITALRKHPKAREKFGVGINAIVVSKYVYGSRCYFVIRADGTTEDFSLRKCFGLPTQPRNEKLATAMRMFNYRAIVTQYHLFVSDRRNRKAS